jgi:hypothetical protein
LEVIIVEQVFTYNTEEASFVAGAPRVEGGPAADRLQARGDRVDTS